MKLDYPLFDGEQVVENASVTVENGIIAAISEAESVDHSCFLMPGLIDAHTHMSDEKQIRLMLQNGVTATCDVSAPVSLIERSKQFTIISSAGMTMGTLNGKGYVKKAIKNGARYIKVLLMEPNLMLKGVLRDICDTAHEHARKVAVHATSLKAVRLAVECGADILLHVPMKEAFPESLAQTIVEKGIAVAPTLVMMETFANSGRGGYKPEHYQNAETAVKLLRQCGVEILAATDANTGSYAPAVPYGSSMRREMTLLAKAGLTPTEVLASATGKVAEVFGIADLGAVKIGKRADLLLIEGRPNQAITDATKIRQIWVGGEEIL